MAEYLTGTVVAEKYRLDSLLRSGDVGDFYRGRHLFMDKPVTLKVLPASLAVDAQIRDQFTAEARSASALTNPHILAANDF
jgi:eukaryotic-like serine/threonine-protein kinase